MSNDISTGKIPVNLVSGKSQKPQQLESRSPGASNTGGATPSGSADRVSMTNAVSRLQEIEVMLKDSPRVNQALVSEVSQLIATGRLEINLERIAANMLETEAGITDPDR